MKKLMTIGFMTLMIIAMSGCGTVAYTVSEKTSPDGTKTYTKAKVFGFGDKASEIAASGMFSDGSDDALGSGFKDANASQKSTGIDGTLAGMGQMFIGMAQLASTFQSMQTGGILPVKTATSVPIVSQDTSGPSAEATIAKNNTVMLGVPSTSEIVILGNKSTCSLCRALWGKLDVTALSAATGASVIDADEIANPSAYKERRISGTDWTWPFVRIYSDGKVVSEFSGRGLTQETLLAKACEALGTCAPTK